MNPYPVIFFGTPEFSVPALQALVESQAFQVKAVVTQPDKPAGRGNRLRSSPVKEYAAQRQIPVLQPKSLRKELPAFLESVSPHGPFAIGVVIAFGQILPREVLYLPQHGCVNIHASLLPRWRGAAPIQRAVMAGDKETGICLMRMDEGLDTGGVFVRVKTDINPTDTAGKLHDALAALGARALIETLPQIISGELTAEPQMSEGITYASKINSEEQHIQWTASSDALARLVLGLSPFPGAWTTLEGKRVKILEASSRNTNVGSATAGEVVRAEKEWLEVYCGQGTLMIQVLQPEGKRAMTTEQFLCGHGNLRGRRFE